MKAKTVISTTQITFTGHTAKPIALDKEAEKVIRAFLLASCFWGSALVSLYLYVSQKS